MQQKKRLIALISALCLLLAGCGQASPMAGVIPSQMDAPGTVTTYSSESYHAPPFASSSFHAELAEGPPEAKIDFSAVREGYVAVAAVSEKRLKFQVLKDEWTYNYDLSSDGTPSIFPLQCGDGLYTFRVMENIAESKYAMLYGTQHEVKLLDEFQPFLRPSDYTDYDEHSECVLLAAKLAEGCTDPLEVVSAVYKYVCKNIKYDSEKAASVRSGYLPDVDETLATGKGICFDYSALAAAMLRSQGIPTKMIFGYVAPDDLYHAWNMFYTEKSGWVTVSFEVSGRDWNRIDLTFSANGASSKFVGDGSHYTDVYSY